MYPDFHLFKSICIDVVDSATGQCTAQGPNFREVWRSVWHLAARQITSTIACRAACQFMAVSLEVGVVQYIEIADIADRMISSIGLNGPADCTDSATTMWSVLLILRCRDNLGLVYETSEQILRWLFNRWGPCKA